MKISFFDRNSEVINTMKKVPVYMYGAGDLGKEIGAYLSQFSIDVVAYVVDDEYYKGNSTGEDGIPIISLSECVKNRKQDDGIVVWAIAKPSKLQSMINSNEIDETWITYDCSMWNDRDFAKKNREKFAETRELLSDERSKAVFDAYLGIFDKNYMSDIAILSDDTYFNILTKIERDGAFVDCGAYIGDSAQNYAKIFGKDRKIFSFEPDPENYKKTVENTKDLNIEIINKGVWSESTTLHFCASGDGASTISESGDITVEVASIDEVVGEEKIAFVKMDIEGSELKALEGMKEVVKRDMPILAISAYHKQEDLITLPQFIKQYESEEEYYELYLMHHGISTSELVIYGIPTKK